MRLLSQATCKSEILTGDCLEYLPALNGVRLLFADPPNNIGINYGAGSRADKLPLAEYLAWFGQWIQAAVRTLTDDGSLWLMVPPDYAEHFAWMLNRAGLTRVDWIIWHETFGQHRTKRFSKTSRFIFWYAKDARNYVFNRDDLRVPSDRQLKYRDKRAHPAGKVPGNVWTIPRVCGKHAERIPGVPTQLPLALLRRARAQAGRAAQVWGQKRQHGYARDAGARGTTAAVRVDAAEDGRVDRSC